MEVIWITGDTHGDWIHRLNMDSFPEQREMTKDDYVIVLGDFGIWRDSPQQRWYLNWLEEKHFTTLFIDGNHECFHKDTDILTINGWMNIKDVVESKENILVASVNMENHNISYSKPLKKVVNYCDKLIEITSSNFKQCVTLNHDIIVNNKKIKANELLKNKFRIEDFRFHINNINPGINIRNEIIELITSVIMDGTIVDYSQIDSNSKKMRVQFHLKKLRKIAYIKSILDRCKIKYTERYMGQSECYLNIYGDDARYINSFLTGIKQIPCEWRNMSDIQFMYFLNAIVNTDGTSSGNNIVWRTTSKHNVDIVTELCIKNNYDINVITLDNASGYTNDGLVQYQISIGKNKRLDEKIKYEIIEYNDNVYCLTMDNGTLITRYKMCPVVSGNCYDILDSYPVEEWHGGKVHFIKPSVIHLMRGQVFDIDDLKFFTFGGAASHDISDGVLEIDDPRIKEWRYDPDKMYRINHISWWEREMPNQKEMDEGIKNLAEHDNKVDFILTHCTASSTAALLSHGLYKPDKLTDYLEEIRCNVDYGRWLCGHYHDNKAITTKDIVLYEQIVRIA